MTGRPDGAALGVAALVLAWGGVFDAACAAAEAAGAERVEVAQRIEIAVRDARTGAPLRAEIELTRRPEAGGDHEPAAPFHLRAAADGTARVDLAPGAWRVRSSYSSFSSLEADLFVGPDAPRAWSFELDPAAPLADSESEIVPGIARFVGVVLAAEDGEPLAGARVSIEGGGEAVSDELGGFEIEIAVAALERDSRDFKDSIEGRDLVVALAGRRSIRLERVLVVEGVHRVRVVLERGSGSVTESDAHRALARVGGAGLEAGSGFEEASPPAGVLAPPASVRVGFANAGCSTICCTASCTAVCVLSLETYIARGLNDEWIASWEGDSLRAGAIAYRSYAAWRVDHPIRPEFDLCSSACCQVNDPDSSASTDAAVAATPGLLLERNAAAFAAEYSAENNSWDDPDDGLSCSNADLSCGDGAVGSPAVGWPCLADAVAAGHGCFGHGRGMSQWGSKRWADGGESWRWILDHYYNANGAPSGLRSATLASPVRPDSGAVCPPVSGPGDRIALHLVATDLAALPRTAVLFGASVVDPDGAFHSDPDDDSPTPLVPGANLETREFDLPAGAPPGLYDVWLAPWLDVDGDGAIESTDFRLGLLVLPDALEVGDRDLVFADCFESGDLTRW